jgi:hypothetical protein
MKHVCTDPSSERPALPDLRVPSRFVVSPQLLIRL